MIETFKILRNIDNVASNKFFTTSSDQHEYATQHATVMLNDSTVPSFGLVKGPSKLALRSNSFLQRVINPWNKLPMAVEDSDSVNLFETVQANCPVARNQSACVLFHSGTVVGEEDFFGPEILFFLDIFYLRVV